MGARSGTGPLEAEATGHTAAGAHGATCQVAAMLAALECLDMGISSGTSW